MIKRVFAITAVLACAQPAAAATVFQNASFFYSTYAEAGGTGPGGRPVSVSQDMEGRAGSAILPATPLRDEVIATAAFAPSGSILAQATARGTAQAQFASADAVSITQFGTYDLAVTPAGSADPLAFASAFPMYSFSFVYDFVVDMPTLMSFTYASDTEYQGRFALNGPNSYSAFLTGNGALSQVLAPGSYGLEIFAQSEAGGSLVTLGTKAGSFSNTYDLKLEPTTAAVPELATWLMLIVGIGLTGSAMRRRRNQTDRQVGLPLLA